MFASILEAKKYLAQFGNALLKTKCAERSNSVRHRLYEVLYETVARHESDLGKSTYMELWNHLRDISAFTRDEQQFRKLVKFVLVCFASSPHVVAIATSLAKAARDAHDERVLELAAEAITRKVEREKLLRLVGEMLQEIDEREKFRRDLARI